MDGLAAGVSPRGIQTNDLDNCVRGTRTFSAAAGVDTGTFSELTRSRLPGIRALTELALGDVRLHLFERPGRVCRSRRRALSSSSTSASASNAPEELDALRRRWIELYESGRYTFNLDRADRPTS